MIVLAGYVLLAIVVMAHVVHRRRPLSEWLVDRLYAAAAVMYAVARAADAALVEYRHTWADVRRDHTPMYVEDLTHAESDHT